ncbi:DUF92 domain-containing protein [Euryarchaeota archaeon]|nr:DUF92 domain-containing protein [Euryarchaeota archaeon]
MIELTDDQSISLLLVLGLLLVTKVRDMLDTSGITMAMIVGLVVSLLGHWTWLVILITFLIIGSTATKWRFEEKLALSIAEENEGTRGWRNVLANGAAPMAVAIAHWSTGDSSWDYLALCSCVSVACSDTLASEIGALDMRTRSILNLKAVPPGTNGGMSPTGTVAALAGAAIIAIFSVALSSTAGDQTPVLMLFTIVGVIGWLGCQIDSLLGALLENEGYIGKHTVNLLATMSGAALAVLASLQFL